MRAKGLKREVREVECDNQLGTCLDRGCHNVPVVRVWKGQRINDRHMTRHNAVSDCPVHQGTCAFQSLPADSRVIVQEVPHPFVVNLDGRTGSKQARLGEAYDEIAYRGGVKGRKRR